MYLTGLHGIIRYVQGNYQLRQKQRAAAELSGGGWNWRKIGVAGAVVAVMLFGAGAVVQNITTEPKKETPKVQARAEFPIISLAELSGAQQRVLNIARQEYRKNPRGYDKTVMGYTEGFHESWCADFISWIFHQANTPFIHQDTDYWRIPGVQTLRAYYEQEGAYHEIGDGYRPKMGDVAFYFGETPDGGSAEHVALILEVRGDKLVTIGGNETDKSIVQIRYDRSEAGTKGLAAIGASGIARSQ